MLTRMTRLKLILTLLIFSLVLALYAPVALAASPSIEIPVTVELTGLPPTEAEEYTIILEADNPANPMPAGSVDGKYSLIITGADTVNLPLMEFDTLGIYTYTIYQLPGTSELATYDDSIYNLVVYVLNASDGSGLETTVLLYLQGETEKLDEVRFINHYDVAKADIKGSKTWIGGKPSDWSAVELELYRKVGLSGQEEKVEVPYATEPNGPNKWIYTWKDLPVTDEKGNAYTYFVKEPAVPEQYDSTVDGTHVTNTFNVGSQDIPVEKIWTGGPYAKPAVTIRLLADGTEVDHVVLRNGVTKHTFKGLPIYKQDGTAIIYTIKEDPVKGYTSKIEGMKVTNKWKDKELPYTGTSSSSVLPMLGIMMALTGVALGTTKKNKK